MKHTLEFKRRLLQEAEDTGMTFRDMEKKHDLPRNTMSSWNSRYALTPQRNARVDAKLMEKSVTELNEILATQEEELAKLPLVVQIKSNARKLEEMRNAAV
jgi:transposase-like protein